MKQSLQIRLGQQLAMTPQLQQAIRLLQLSTLELQTEVQQAVDSNMMLEIAEDDPAEGDRAGADGEPEVAPTDIPQELAVDSDWDDVYDTGPNIYSAAPAAGAEPERQQTSAESLHQFLASQMSLLRLSEADQLIAAALIDSIDDDGYLQATLEEIHESVLANGLEIDVDEVAACLRQLQNCDPPGVACRGLGECLRLQLHQLPEGTPYRGVAIEMVSEHLAALGSRDFASLMKLFKLSREELNTAFELIRTLNPRPGSSIESRSSEYVIPDVFVKKIKGMWHVELNPDAFPKVRVNSEYAGLIKGMGRSQDSTALRTHLQEAKWFLKSLRSRTETLLKVATCIVERQQAFLEYGEEAMKPMVLHDVAATVEMHESTISRVTTQKFMHTPRGIFELKYFFSSHVQTDSGGEASAIAIRALLKKLIAAENTRKPLRDSKLAKILSDQGIKVARRTVAKYREGMAIPSSSERKSLI